MSEACEREAGKIETICCALECGIRGNSEPGLVMALIAGPLYANQGAIEHRQGRADHSKGPTMYQINFETCTMNDVIVRSIVCHPTMLIDTLHANASIHYTARDVMHDKTAAAAAQRCGNQCREAADLIVSRPGYTAIAIVSEFSFGERMATFLAAAKLQLIPFATQHDICKRDDVARGVAA